MNDTISAAEWSEQSKAGKRCGMFGCFADHRDLAKCSLCEHHYCIDDLPVHEGVPHPVGARANPSGRECSCVGPCSKCGGRRTNAGIIAAHAVAEAAKPYMAARDAISPNLPEARAVLCDALAAYDVVKRG